MTERRCDVKKEKKSKVPKRKSDGTKHNRGDEESGANGLTDEEGVEEGRREECVVTLNEDGRPVQKFNGGKQGNAHKS